MKIEFSASEGRKSGVYPEFQLERNVGSSEMDSVACSGLKIPMSSQIMREREREREFDKIGFRAWIFLNAELRSCFTFLLNIISEFASEDLVINVREDASH